MKTGVLSVNLGSPEKCNTESIRSYLKSFLMDKRVVDIPFILRWVLVHLIILPFRPKKILPLYQSIWMKDGGSPLRVYNNRFSSKLSHVLGDDFLVEPAMTYGSPSLKEAYENLLSKGCKKFIILPHYPQYATSSTGASYAKWFELQDKEWDIYEQKLLGHYFDQEFFINAFAQKINQFLVTGQHDHLLLSYHGLPERHLTKSKLNYKDQCFKTSDSLADKLNLKKDFYSTSFQSRLGRTPWIKPYTDEILIDLIQKGIRRLLVSAPSFTMDCLETLEEIEVRTKEAWIKLGGQTLTLVPSLNDDDEYVHGIAEWLKK